MSSPFSTSTSLLETHQLTQSIFNTINVPLAKKNLFLRESTIIDVTLTATAPSAKNEKRGGQIHKSQDVL
ncbi:hypothetical protein NTGHW29_450057 [Candidatus Nitrotoga sp. HW29]|uniref:hypothetical protein n=1 Tax=Candidatus Nitrotoga sp. HW29 TaxID=2886963 RepID=UPI001EF195C3|nr:hypothetical protein [Candidatus Nitrotoga sp. HW29]CAH1905157.1 hypothetical protein NTGHW29_450057 [Candidatus Nitrotoga sp. HW29]